MERLLSGLDYIEHEIFELANTETSALLHFLPLKTVLSIYPVQDFFNTEQNINTTSHKMIQH